MIKFDYIFGAGQPKPKIPMPNIHIRWVHPPEQRVRPLYRSVTPNISKSLPDIIELGALFNMMPATGELLNEKLSTPPIRGVVLNEKLSNISTGDSWMTERFKNKFSEDLTEAVKLLNKNLNTNLKKEGKKMDIKAELHKLVDGLDENRLNKDKFVFIDETAKFVLLDVLKKCQMPVEKTLEQKLIDAGFEKSCGWNNVYHKEKIQITLVKEPESSYVMTKYSGNKNGIWDNLQCNINDHDQIFADIAYLQQR